MSRRPFYKRFPDDFLMATRELTLEERGAYNDLLDLMYGRGRPIPDEEKWLAGFLGIGTRKWRGIREALLAAGKLVQRGEYLSNARFEREVELDSAEHDKAVQWGRMGGKRRAQAAAAAQGNLGFAEEKSAKSMPAPKAPLDGDKEANSGDKSPRDAETDSLERVFGAFSASFQSQSLAESEAAPANINGLAQGPLKPARASHIPESRKRDTSVSLLPDAKPRKPGSKSRSKSKRATTLKAGWMPAELTPEVEALVARWPAKALERELGKFRDHAAQNGRTAKDWNAAWRNWLRKADEHRERDDRRPGKGAGWGGVTTPR